MRFLHLYLNRPRMNPQSMNPALSTVMFSISVTQDVAAIMQTVTYGEFRSISSIIVNIQRAKPDNG